jgi:hypothetical protein
MIQEASDESTIIQPCVFVKFMEEGSTGINELYSIIPDDAFLKLSSLIDAKKTLLSYTTEDGQLKVCIHFNPETRACASNDEENGYFMFCKAIQGMIRYQKSSADFSI